MREILVTGGNGFVGRHVVAALQDQGDRVRVLALPAEDTRWLEARDVRVHRGDIRAPDTLTGPMRGADAVLHLAAIMDVWRPLAAYRAVNVDGTANVCRAALRAGVGRLVHMSSSSVYGVALGRPADETFPLAPFPDPYAQTKAEADLLVQREVRDAQLPAVIVRPDQIFGPGDAMHFGRMADRLQAGRGVIIGSGANAIPLVYISDAVQGLLLALDRAQAAGEAYNISAREPLTQGQFVRAVARELGVAPPRVHIPYRALHGAARLAEWLCPLVAPWTRPPLTRLGVAFFGTDSRYVIDKACRELGYAPQVDLLDGVRLAVRWYQQRGRGECAPVNGHPDVFSIAPTDVPAKVEAPRARVRAEARSATSATGLRNRVAVVTGASSGIGAATAAELGRRGAKVILVARRREALEAQAGAIRRAGGEAEAVVADVGDADAVRSLVERTLARYGRIDVLVNNAGVFWRTAMAVSASEDLIDVVEVNLIGALLLTRAVLPGMLARGHGVIICVGSLSGRVAMEPVYSATKYGLRGFTLALRRQLAGTGVSVSLVSPGNIRTPMTAHLDARLPEPDLVAGAIAGLAVHPRREVVIPRRHYLITWLEQLLPSVADLVHKRRRWSPVPEEMQWTS